MAGSWPALPAPRVPHERAALLDRRPRRGGACVCANGARTGFSDQAGPVIVPYAAGGSGDLLARLLGDKLARIWGQQPVIDNKPGARGLIGTEAAAKADPDGYTIYLATDGPVTVAPTLHKKPLSYDWKRDFAPISMMAVGYQILLDQPEASGHQRQRIDRAAEDVARQIQLRLHRDRQRAAHGQRIVPVGG